MRDGGEVERFHDRCSDLMRELLEALAAAPDRPRPFPQVEDGLGWPRRRIASVLGGVARLRQAEFGGRRPYHFHDARHSASGRWEIWMDGVQAEALRTSVGRMATVTPIEDLRLSATAALFEGRDDIPVSIFVTEYARGQGPDLHTHPYAEAFVVETGTATFTAGDEQISVSGGNVVVVPAETVHGFKCAGDDQLRVVSVHPSPTVQQTNL